MVEGTNIDSEESVDMSEPQVFDIRKLRSNQEKQTPSELVIVGSVLEVTGKEREEGWAVAGGRGFVQHAQVLIQSLALLMKECLSWPGETAQ